MDRRVLCWRWLSCSSSSSSPPSTRAWSVPVAVILSLPVAGIGAYLGIWVCGLENNIYFQIGLVMLVGLVAKNAILIVEFAKEEVEKAATWCRRHSRPHTCVSARS